MLPTTSKQKDQPTKRKTRRSGTRSRTGCSRCVKVSRKCDEAHPVCSRCQRLGFECIYESRYIWKTARLSPTPPSPVTSTPVPCSCRQRPTNAQLLEAFKSAGHKAFHWNTASSSLLTVHLLPMYDMYPAVRAAVEAQMALTHDCCNVSALSRIDYAVSQTREYLQLVEAQQNDTRAAMGAMLLLSQVSMRAGYPWTWQMERMLTLVLAMPGESERQQYLEILGGLDMNVWIVGRQSPPLHIWANYCRKRQGVEDLTGLPRPLLDLISLVSRGEDVSCDLEQYSATLSPMEDAMTETCQALILAARIYLQEEPLFPLLNELFTLVTRLKQQMLNSDLGILAWPAYTLGSRGYRWLAEDVLSTVSGSCLPDGVTALRGSPLGAMRSYWASVGVLDASLTRDCDGAEIGLW